MVIRIILQFNQFLKYQEASKLATRFLEPQADFLDPQTGFLDLLVLLTHFLSILVHFLDFF